MRVDASAPSRIDLAGGTIDIWPLYLYHDNAVTVNFAIDLHARCTITPHPEGRIVVESRDTERSVDVAHWSELRDNFELKLLARLVHFFRPPAGLSLTCDCESPAGAGLGGSSALNIATCGALNKWLGERYERRELLRIARNVEAQAIEVPAGEQDYYPAMYGGVEAVCLDIDGVKRVELPTDVHELESRIALCYTGAPRNSGTNNWEIMKRHIDGDRDIFDKFERIRDTAVAMRAALVEQQFERIGELIAEEWENRKRLAPTVSTDRIEELIGVGLRRGAVAAKVCGAGGGGCMILYGSPDAIPGVRAALRAADAHVLDFRIAREGLRITLTD